MADRQNYMPRLALTKAEHDAIVEILGRPVTQSVRGEHRNHTVPEGFVPDRKGAA